LGPAVELIVGLGNPAPAYTKTRHNIGREFISYLTESWGPEKSKKRFFYKAAPEGEFGFFARPIMAGVLDSYMNESGFVLKPFMAAENISPDKVLVIVDDFMIPLGTLRLRPKGSSGGHNGLKSFIEALGSDEFARLRVGIGPVPEKQDPADFVLHRFSSAEQKTNEKLYPIIKDGVRVLIDQGFEKAMSFLNKDHAAQ
jgi:PTH1 family peptidyl-tRNA hydrolase